ncbi:MAG: hypothetical protein HN348_28625, partial [Proteobacteria bacterium]|nr:hypothetical protein [Pseudomonadota bacterium]
GLPQTYADKDEDGYGDPNAPFSGCEKNGLTNADDCNDGDNTVYPGAPELCDGKINDCAASDLPDNEVDDDGDGYVECTIDAHGWHGVPSNTSGDDCDDHVSTGSTVYPGAPETACDGIDSDCDGEMEHLVPTIHQTIQDAIDAAPDNGIVCVESGTYVENIDLGTSNITVWGIDGPQSTIIDGGGVDTVVKVGNTTSAVIDGFSISNGHGVEGGGINLQGSIVTLNNLIVSTNDALYGGGVWCEGASPTMTDVVITGNTAINDGGGIGLFSCLSSVVLSDVTIADNTAANGGGLYMRESWDETSLSFPHSGNQISNTSISGNSATYGGGVYIYDGEQHDEGDTGYFKIITTEFSNVIVSGNFATYGGGLSIQGDTKVVLANVTISGNSATSDGGGLYLDAATTYAEPQLINLNISSNEATSGGGGYVSASYLGSCTLTYSNLWGNSGDDYYGMVDPIGNNDNFSHDPDFVSFSPAMAWSTWDFHLGAASPLINAGNPAADYFDPDGSTNDVGAFGGPGVDFSYYADNDADGLFDGWEEAFGLDTSTDDSSDDGDSDGLANSDELAAGTDPTKADTDGDGTIDGDDIDPLDASVG